MLEAVWSFSESSQELQDHLCGCSLWSYMSLLDSLSVLFSSQDCRSVHLKCLLASKLCERGRHCCWLLDAAEAAGLVLLCLKGSRTGWRWAAVSHRDSCSVFPGRPCAILKLALLSKHRDRGVCSLSRSIVSHACYFHYHSVQVYIYSKQNDFPLSLEHQRFRVQASFM